MTRHDAATTILSDDVRRSGSWRCGGAGANALMTNLTPGVSSVPSGTRMLEGLLGNACILNGLREPD